MPTHANENYLKALYYLHIGNPEISLTDLGQVLEVSKPTVNEMVKKLHKQGWLTYEKYKPLRLTANGKRQAAMVIRKHRLSEMFLSQIMGFGWEEVHEMAEELEHLKTEKLFDRMDELLGFPTNDPHGSPIPDKEGNFSKFDYKTLSQAKVGDKLILKALRNSASDFLVYLNKKEISLGLEISVDQIEVFDKSITVSYAAHKNVVLSQAVASSLLVDEI